MSLETVSRAAGGVFMIPNWWRISDALAKYGVRVSPEALKAADPHARRKLDDLKIIGGATGPSRGWLVFDLILPRARVTPPAGTAAGLGRRDTYPTTRNP